MLLRRIFDFEKKIDKPAQIQSLDGRRKKGPTFPANSSDVTQKAELVSRSEHTNAITPKHISQEYSANC